MQGVVIGSVCCALSERISEHYDCHRWAKQRTVKRLVVSWYFSRCERDYLLDLYVSKFHGDVESRECIKVCPFHTLGKLKRGTTRLVKFRVTLPSKRTPKRHASLQAILWHNRFSFRYFVSSLSSTQVTKIFTSS